MSNFESVAALRKEESVKLEGYAPDPPAMRIVEYENRAGITVYRVVFAGEQGG